MNTLLNGICNNEDIVSWCDHKNEEVETVKSNLINEFVVQTKEAFEH